jgi:hypothetical protein
MVGRTTYRPYLERRYKGQWWLRFLNKVAETRVQKDLNLYLKNDENRGLDH